MTNHFGDANKMVPVNTTLQRTEKASMMIKLLFHCQMEQVSMQSIATATGFSKMTVSRVLRNIPNSNPKTVELVRKTAAELGYDYMPPKVISPKIEEMLSRGVHPKEVITTLGVGISTVYWARKKLGLPVFKSGRKLGGKNKHHKWTGTVADIRQMKESGMTYQQIADQLGVTFQRIQQLIRAQRGSACEKCGATERLHAHHINYITNEAQTLCGSCHTKEHFRLKRVTRTKPVDLTMVHGVSV